jgi:hypothetical protein
MGLNSLYWVLACITGYAADFDQQVLDFIYVSGAAMVIYSSACLLLFKNGKTLRFCQLLGFLLCNAICFYATRLDAIDLIGHRGLPAIWIFGSAFGIAILPFRNRVHTVIVVLISILFFYGFKSYPEPLVGWSVGTSLVLIMSNAQIVIHRLFKLSAMNAFRRQVKFTPKQVILNAIELGLSVDAVFPPESRFCVCICSDWRGFQKWTSANDSSAISKTLKTYYELQVKLLDQAFPDGNYFMDWIADELFVVAFSNDKTTGKQLIRAGVDFCIKSISVREEFSAAHGAPFGVDFGLCFGEATVGILGPEGNAKATALGAVPGQARRMQLLAKSLRASEGHTDRILLTKQTSDYLDTGELGFNSLKINAGVEVKDMINRDFLCGTAQSIRAANQKMAEEKRKDIEHGLPRKTG